jgi:hypothetical protein
MHSHLSTPVSTPRRKPRSRPAYDEISELYDILQMFKQAEPELRGSILAFLRAAAGLTDERKIKELDAAFRLRHGLPAHA